MNEGKIDFKTGWINKQKVVDGFIDVDNEGVYIEYADNKYLYKIAIGLETVYLSIENDEEGYKEKECNFSQLREWINEYPELDQIGTTKNEMEIFSEGVKWEFEDELLVYEEKGEYDVFVDVKVELNILKGSLYIKIESDEKVMLDNILYFNDYIEDFQKELNKRSMDVKKRGDKIEWVLIINDCEKSRKAFTDGCQVVFEGTGNVIDVNDLLNSNCWRFVRGISDLEWNFVRTRIGNKEKMKVRNKEDKKKQNKLIKRSYDSYLDGDGDVVYKIPYLFIDIDELVNIEDDILQDFLWVELEPNELVESLEGNKFVGSDIHDFLKIL